MAYSTVPAGARKLVYFGGTMAWAKGEPTEGLIENFDDQIGRFFSHWEAKGENPEEVTIVVGFNSQESIDALNAMGENVTLAAPDTERIRFMTKLQKIVVADAIIMFDEPKLGELFQRQADAGQPFVDCVKRGYNGTGENGLPICEGMKWIVENGGSPLTLPDWVTSDGEKIGATTVKTHMPKT